MPPQFDAIIYAASIWVIPLIIAITFHEAAHGYVARFFGDNTAWQFGRVTLNPFKHIGGVEMWRGGFRLHISVSASFVWRCLSGVAVTPFPHPARRTGQAALPHPALGQDLTPPSPTACRAQARLGVRARSARKGARVDRSRPCIA